MTPFYWRNTLNFGDCFNAWLWPRLFGSIVDVDDGIRLIGIGSLIRSELDFVKGKKVIFGTGSGYGTFPARSSTKEWLIYFVRGPLTARRLQIPRDQAIVDGAWLISQVSDPTNVCRKSGTLFIPHWKTAESGNWATICSAIGFEYLDPRDQLETVLQRIASSELVITESLHGAIFADYYRTPWIPVRLSTNFLNFKWYDWCESIDVPLSVITLPPSDFVDSLYLGRLPQMRCTMYDVCDNPVCEDFGESESTIHPGKHYQHERKLRSVLRHCRKRGFDVLRSAREIPPLSLWNSRYRDSLRKSLANLRNERSFLSKDSVRESLIERLSEAKERLVSDYQSGRILD